MSDAPQGNGGVLKAVIVLSVIMNIKRQRLFLQDDCYTGGKAKHKQ